MSIVIYKYRKFHCHSQPHVLNEVRKSADSELKDI